jgi:hypothetical protein
MNRRRLVLNARSLHPLRWFGLGVGVAVAALTLFDPRRGAARRAQLRDQALSRGRALASQARRHAIDLGRRAQGAVHEARARLEAGAVPDHVLAERVRAQLGRPVSHPGALEVEVHAGCVEVRGPILADEAQDLLARIRRVPGVKDVIDRLELHETPGNVPSLQGPGSRQAR